MEKTMNVNSSLKVSDDMKITGGDGLPMEGGIRTPGFFNFTICLDPKEAVDNINNNVFPPCGTAPQVPASAGTNINAPGSFTPGFCKIHVTQ
jgi:hypothetical protein